MSNRSEIARRGWADPAIRARRVAAMRVAATQPQARAQRAAASRRAWADPEKRQRMAAGLRAAYTRPDVRAKVSEIRRKQWSDPEFRRRRDVLTPEQRAQLLDQLRAGASVHDVANDWLITAGHVWHLARVNGVRVARSRSPLTVTNERRTS